MCIRDRGSTGTQLNPSSYNVPAFLSVQAADDWDIHTSTSGVAGNTNIYFAATADGINSDMFMSYKEGELFLAGGGGSASNQPITFLPADNVTGLRPETAYQTDPTIWANVNYANTSASTGSKFSVTNGTSTGAGTVGDMQVELKRRDNSVAEDQNIPFIFTSSLVGFLPNGHPLVTFETSESRDGAFAGETVTMSASGTFTNSASGNESGMGGNSYELEYAFFNSGTYGGGIYFIKSGGTRQTYSDIGGTDSTGNAVAQASPKPTATRTIASGVTEKAWTLNLEEQSDGLKLQGNASTVVEFTNNITDFSNRVKFKNHTSAEILALTGMTAGEVVYNSTDNLVAYYDGTNWRNIAQGAIVT